MVSVRLYELTEETFSDHSRIGIIDEDVMTLLRGGCNNSASLLTSSTMEAVIHTQHRRVIVGGVNLISLQGVQHYMQYLSKCIHLNKEVVNFLTVQLPVLLRDLESKSPVLDMNSWFSAALKINTIDDEELYDDEKEEEEETMKVFQLPAPPRLRVPSIQQFAMPCDSPSATRYEID